MREIRAVIFALCKKTAMKICCPLVLMPRRQIGAIMQIQTNKKGTGFFKNVSAMFIIYWGILVVWQNISGATTRGTIDVLLKIGLLGYFSVFYLLKAKTFHAKGLVVALLAMSLLVTFFTESQLQLSTMIAYVYPILVLFLVYGLGDNMQINRSQLVVFCNCVIGITAYAAIYAVLFCWDQFVGAFSLTSAYGNELSSFFVSNHEYGMYLLAAIVSVIICIRLCPNMNNLSKGLCIAALVLFSANLILTFSRTSLLGLGVFLLSYCFFETPKARKWIIIVSVLIGILLLVVPSLREFVYRIVLKENTAAGREELTEYAVQYFKDGSIFEKVFGHGYAETRANFKTDLDHGSVHNGYLQVLLYFGLIGCGAMVLFVLSQIIVSIRFLREDRFTGVVSLALALCAAAMMVTNTAILFTSQIDSFFLTMFFILVPKYVRNCVQQNGFYGNSDNSK